MRKRKKKKKERRNRNETQKLKNKHERKNKTNTTQSRTRQTKTKQTNKQIPQIQRVIQTQVLYHLTVKIITKMKILRTKRKKGKNKQK